MAIKPRQSSSAQPSTVSDADLRHHSQELGWFGSILGSKENAPVYIAGLLALISLVGAIAVGIADPQTPARADAFKALISVVIASLSFLGGYAGRPRGRD